MPLRSQDWFGRTGKDGFIYRAWMKNQGFPHHEFEGKPVIDSFSNSALVNLYSHSIFVAYAVITIYQWRYEL